jgi:hypothetical protein
MCVSGFCWGDLSFEFVTIHPDASLQPTVRGKSLSSIHQFGGMLYFGYGDWAADTGPVAIRGYSPGAGQWSEVLLQMGTEAISHYREIGGQLHASMVDPMGTPGLSSGGFARGTPQGQWSQFSTIPNAVHTFDIVGGSSSDLWAVGSQGTSAAVWRSQDGGQTFDPIRLDSVAAGSPPFAFARYTGIGNLNGQFIVQRVDVNAADVGQSLVFNGLTWDSGPDLMPLSEGVLHRPETFDNQLVYLDSQVGPGKLYRFDGTAAHLAIPGSVRDFSIANGRLLALLESGDVAMTEDLAQWTILGSAPQGATSLTWFDQSLYVGTDQSQLFRSQLRLNAVPEPGSLALTGAVALAVAARARRWRWGLATQSRAC